jgi:hypothetical protein
MKLSRDKVVLFKLKPQDSSLYNNKIKKAQNTNFFTMNFSTMNNNNVFDTKNDLFTLPIICLSDSEEINNAEFELFPESKPTPAIEKSSEFDSFLNICDSKSTLKSKAGSTELTRADSIESLTVLSGQVKSIKKVKSRKKSKTVKKKNAKTAKKIKKTEMLSHYHQAENTEFTS